MHAQAIDEHVQKPQHCRLPAGLIVHVAHADKRPQNVFGTDIGADLAGCDGAVQEGTDSLCQAIERIGGKFRRLASGKRQRNLLTADFIILKTRLRLLVV